MECFRTGYFRRLRAFACRSRARRSTCSNMAVIMPSSATMSPATVKKQRGRLPQRPIAGKPLLKSAAYERHAEGKQREQQQCPGQDV